MKKTQLACVMGLLLLVALTSCWPTKDPLRRIIVLDNPWFKVTSGPLLLAEQLNNPMSPRLTGDKLIVAESGAGNVSSVENGKTYPLITGFVTEKYDGYNISVEGITIDPSSGLWIITAAEGPGRVLLFNPSTFPIDMGKGREFPINGAVDDNPFTSVLAAGGRILVVSGGTKTAYQAEFNPGGDLGPLTSVVEVKTGLIGLTVDATSGDIFGAVFGDGPGTGEVVRWNPTEQPVILETVATGLTNPIDVTFTPDDSLLVLEFGEYGSKGTGRVSIVDVAAGGSITPFITGLNNPSGFFVGADNTLYLTEYGETTNASDGTLISLQLVPIKQR